MEQTKDRKTFSQMKDSFKRDWNILQSITPQDLMKRDEASNLPLLLISVVGILAIVAVIIYLLHRIFT